MGLNTHGAEVNTGWLHILFKNTQKCFICTFKWDLLNLQYSTQSSGEYISYTVKTNLSSPSSSTAK